MFFDPKQVKGLKKVDFFVFRVAPLIWVRNNLEIAKEATSNETWGILLFREYISRKTDNSEDYHWNPTYALNGPGYSNTVQKKDYKLGETGYALLVIYKKS